MSTKRKVGSAKASTIEANREKLIEDSRKYVEDNRESVKRSRRRHYDATRETKRKADRQYREANPEKKQEYDRLRRARKLGQLGTMTPGIKHKLWERQKRRCAGPGCGIRIVWADAHLDHYIAVAKGGLYDDANFQVLCAPCNCSKGAKDPIEWAQSRGLLL